MKSNLNDILVVSKKYIIEFLALLKTYQNPHP
jgi:hypothetical protein